MILVLDASAAIEIVLKREKSAIFSTVVLSSRKVISTDLYKIEVTNTLWKYVKAGLIDRSLATEILKLAQDLVDEFIDIAENNEEALIESIRLNHSSYDLLYFTLARRYGGKLMTLDKKLGELAEKNGIEVID